MTSPANSPRRFTPYELSQLRFKGAVLAKRLAARSGGFVEWTGEPRRLFNLELAQIEAGLIGSEFEPAGV